MKGKQPSDVFHHNIKHSLLLKKLETAWKHFVHWSLTLKSIVLLTVIYTPINFRKGRWRWRVIMAGRVCVIRTTKQYITAIHLEISEMQVKAQNKGRKWTFELDCFITHVDLAQLRKDHWIVEKYRFCSSVALRYQLLRHKLMTEAGVGKLGKCFCWIFTTYRVKKNYAGKNNQKIIRVNILFWAQKVSRLIYGKCHVCSYVFLKVLPTLFVRKVSVKKQTTNSLFFTAKPGGSPVRNECVTDREENRDVK